MTVVKPIKRRNTLDDKFDNLNTKIDKKVSLGIIGCAMKAGVNTKTLLGLYEKYGFEVI